jgi:hypothetical protein
MRFDQPKLMIDAARDLGDEIRGVGVVNCHRLSDRLSGRSPNRAFGDSAEAGGAFGQQVGIALGFLGDLVEQLVDGDEGWTPLPVRLLHLAVQIDRARWAPVQKVPGLGADTFG